MAWGWGPHYYWAFVPQMSPMLGWEVVEVRWYVSFCLRRPNSLPGADPSAGALLKAAFICAGIVHVHSKLSLREQLLSTFGGGFELHTWSELPHGSGLGEWALYPCCQPLHARPPASPCILLAASAPEGMGGAGLGWVGLFHA